MKYFYSILLLILSAFPSYSQEFIKHATVHFKDATVAKGDFYYYPTIAQSATVVDSLDKKQVYDLASIDYIEGRIDLYRVIDYNGSANLFEAITEGEKAGLYKTNFGDNIQFYVLKEDKLYWLEGKDFILESDGNKYKKKNYRYQGTLKFLFSDNDYVIDKIEELTYIESKITPLVIAYNDGHVTYLKSKEFEKQNRISDWKVYAQYSIEDNETYFLFNPLKNIDFKLFQAGAEYFVSEQSRYSFKIGLEYCQFETYSDTHFDTITKKDGQWINLNCSYYYDVLKTYNGNIYMGVRLVDIGWSKVGDDEKLYIYPKLSPLLGYEHHITKKMDLYAELNHIFHMSKLPMNFTFGLSYDL